MGFRFTEAFGFDFGSCESDAWEWDENGLWKEVGALALAVEESAVEGRNFVPRRLIRPLDFW